MKCSWTGIGGEGGYDDQDQMVLFFLSDVSVKPLIPSH